MLVGESTYHATSAAIAYEPAGEQLLKGKQAPVAGVAALRVVARRRRRGTRAKASNRRSWVATKSCACSRTRSTRRARAEAAPRGGLRPGRHRQEPPHVGAREVPRRRGRPGAVLLAPGSFAGIWRGHRLLGAGRDGPSTRAHRRGRGRAIDAREARGDASRSSWSTRTSGAGSSRAWRALLGHRRGDWAGARAALQRVAHVLRAHRRRGPTVLVFEDLQRADKGLLDFIEHLLEWTARQPILVVTLARPELLERRPTWALGQRALIALHLEPLSARRDARAAAGGLVPGAADGAWHRSRAGRRRAALRRRDDPLVARIGQLRARRRQRTRSRRAYRRSTIPPTLRALIAVAPRRAAGDDRSLLQDAAVLGQSFSLAALAACRAPDAMSRSTAARPHPQGAGQPR